MAKLRPTKARMRRTRSKNWCELIEDYYGIKERREKEEEEHKMIEDEKTRQVRQVMKLNYRTQRVKLTTKFVANVFLVRRKSRFKKTVICFKYFFALIFALLSCLELAPSDFRLPYAVASKQQHQELSGSHHQSFFIHPSESIFGESTTSTNFKATNKHRLSEDEDEMSFIGKRESSHSIVTNGDSNSSSEIANAQPLVSIFSFLSPSQGNSEPQVPTNGSGDLQNYSAQPASDDDNDDTDYGHLRVGQASDKVTLPGDILLGGLFPIHMKGELFACFHFELYTTLTLSLASFCGWSIKTG